MLRRGDFNRGAVTEIAIAQLERLGSTDLAKVRMLTAVRTGTGKLKLIAFEQSEDGEQIEDLGEAEGPTIAPGSEVSLTVVNKNRAVTSVVSGGTLSLTLWSISARMDTEHTTAATAVQTASGNLKIILWQLARSNGYLIRHGDDVRGYEVVGYWHMSKLEEALLAPGTPVNEGQRLGLLGNSGASGLPHLHIHAVKAPDGVSLPELIKQAADGTWSEANDTPYRPISFHNARAMLKANLKTGGVWKNPFSVLDGDGIHFDFYAVFPGPAAKPGIAAQIKALQKKVDELQSKGIGIGCKI